MRKTGQLKYKDRVIIQKNDCNKILKFPFVYNMCDKKYRWRFKGRIYNAEYADEKARKQNVNI